MFTCKIENEYGEQLNLSEANGYTVYKIDGLAPPPATINTSPVANFDGSHFNSSRVNERNIVVYVAINKNCESNRINLYRYVRSKRYIKFYYKNSARDVYAEGYVENMDIGFFEMKQVVQISILCPYPYFKSATCKIINLSNVKPMFTFPFAYEESGAPFSVLKIAQETSIINGGEIENGITITIQAIGRALNPTIYNLSKSEFFKINVDLFVGDVIEITTNKSQKKVELTHEGVTTNVINSVEYGSTWFQLLPGDNLFSYTADEYEEHLLCNVAHRNEYEGV